MTKTEVSDIFSKSCSSMAAKYELPEEVNEERLKTLEREVEMKTFKTNVDREGTTKEVTKDGIHKSLKQTSHQGDNDHRDNGTTMVAPLVKLFCAGDYTGGRDQKGAFIEDYLQVRRPLAQTKSRTPTTRVGRYFKMMKWQRKSTEKSFLIKLHLQILEISESDLNTNAIYSKFRLGALVFWEAGSPSSLEVAKTWRQNIKQFLASIPCVLITDNVTKPGQESLRWIGPGKTFENEVALDQFCKDHGFVDHFEIKSRDWESGEKSVFG